MPVVAKWLHEAPARPCSSTARMPLAHQRGCSAFATLKGNPLETSDIGQTDDAGQAPREYEAWACGCHIPVTLGSTGTCASGWEIRQKGEAVPLQAKEIASKDTNRREWEASIMAAFGVVEFVEIASVVLIRMTNPRLIDAIKNNFVNADGSLTAGEAFWRQFQELRRTKRLSLSAVPATPRDEVMANLKARVKSAAKERLEEIGLRPGVSRE